jgi:hypothetical protein
MRLHAGPRWTQGPEKGVAGRVWQGLVFLQFFQGQGELLDWQGYLAHKKQPTPLGPPRGPKRSPTVGSEEVAGYYECTPVALAQGAGGRRVIPIEERSGRVRNGRPP